MSSDFLAEQPQPDPSNDHRDSGANQRPSRAGCLKLGILMALCLFFFIVLIYLLVDLNRGTVVALIREIRKPEVVEVEVEKIVEKEVVKEKIVEVEKKEPLPSRYLSRKTIDTVKLWNGLNVESELQTLESPVSATGAREDDSSFEVRVNVNFGLPKAATELEQLAALNPELPKVLPDLGRMMESAKVSKFFPYLYELKARRIQQYLTRFDRVLSRHNVYDCETILELTHPDTSQRALLIQAEMDVVSDGSDGDRWPQLDDYISMSDNYQYSTSYAWPKKTRTPNPLLAKREAELKEREARFAVKGLSIEENRMLRGRIETLKREIPELKARSFLIAEADPFIVIPLSMLGRRDETPFGPAIGDYAAVIHEGKVYPAIAGDAGPSYKVGEASLRMAKALNENAGVYNRPVSDLEVTYLVFPGSADENRDAPDLEKWHARCEELLQQIGGIGEGYEIHEWEDVIAKKIPAKTRPVEAPAASRPAGN